MLSRKDGKGDRALLPSYQKGLPTSIPPVVELQDMRTTSADFDVAERLKPIPLKTKKEAAKYFTPEALKTLEKHVDFDNQFVLILAWKGSGQDRRTYDEAFALQEVRDVEFRLRPGRTRGLRPHEPEQTAAGLRLRTDAAAIT